MSERLREFMDVHHGLEGISTRELADRHTADLTLQVMERVTFKHAWADPVAGVMFCLTEAPSAEAVLRVHQRSGHPADEIYDLTVRT